MTPSEQRMLFLLPLWLALAPAATAQSGLLRLSASAYQATEASPTVKITVTRINGSSGTLIVDFTTVDGTALDGQDYRGTNGTLTFGPGEKSKFFYVPIINDAAHEDSETFTVELVPNLDSPAPDPRTDPANATVTILDNDACTYTLDPVRITIDEVGRVGAMFHVMAPDGCSWLATSTANWVGITTPSGAGNGEITFNVDLLDEGIPTRTSTIQVGGKTFTITQTRPPADLTPPTLTIRTPLAGSRQTNSEITVTGIAADNVGVTRVEFRVENTNGVTEYADATGTSSWSALVSGLVPGTNLIRIRAHDAAANLQEATRAINYVEVSPITLTKAGLGTITPLVNGQWLDVGKSYSATARPASRYFFTGWSGSIESTENPLAFPMSAGFALQANFILTPFAPVAGTYNGLYHEEAVMRHQSSGFLTVKVADLGTFSARLAGGGKRYSFSGHFALDGLATNTVSAAGTPPLQVVLNLDLVGGSDQIGGTISNGLWEATLHLFRDIFDPRTNAAPQAGLYTVLIPGEPTNSAAQPGGASFGTVVVGKDGTAKLTATLADGTKVTSKSTLSKEGLWPTYIPLAGGAGSISSLCQFVDDIGSDLSGAFTWIKPPVATAKYYAAGFSVQPTLTGSRYQPPTNNTQRVLALSAGRMMFTAGNLAEDFSEQVTVTADGKVTDGGTNKLVMTLQKSTGLFTGSVLSPRAIRKTTIQGAIHQKGNFASGFFLGTNQSGRILLLDEAGNL